MSDHGTHPLDALDDVAHVETEVRLTPAGRTLAVVALAGFAPTLAIGGAASTLPAAAGALLLVAAAASWRNLAGARVAVRGFLRGTSSERAVLTTAVRAGGAPLRDALVYHDRGEHVSARGLVAHLARGAAVALESPYRMPLRGHHTVHRATLRSTYPFGLVERRHRFRQHVDHLSRPRLGALGPGARRLVESLAPGAESGGTRRGYDEFHGLRPWRDGEGTRLVHWRLSARTGRRVVRELAGDDRPPIHLYLWPGVRGKRSVRRHRAFEDAVALTASLARELLRSRARLRLTVLGEDPESDRTIDARRGALVFEAVLDTLARVASVPRPPGDGPRRSLGDAPTHERRVLVCAGDRPGGVFDAVVDAESRDVDPWFESPYEGLGPARRA